MEQPTEVTEIIVLEKVSELRKTISENETAAFLYFQESREEAKLLEIEASKCTSQELVYDDMLFNSTGSIALKNKKFAKDLEDKRLGVTTPINDYIKQWIEGVRKLQAPHLEIERVISEKRNKYLAQKELERKQLEEKLEHDKNVTIELSSLKLKMENAYYKALSEEINKVTALFNKSWNTITSENFEQKMASMKMYSPKIGFDILLSYFVFEVKYISLDVLEGKIKEYVSESCYQEFTEEFLKRYRIMRQGFIDKIPEKKFQLETLSNEALRKKQDEEKAILDQAEINRRSAEISEEKEREFKINAVESETAIEESIKVNTTLKTVGISKGIRRIKVASFDENPVDWNVIVNLYINSNGASGVEFLLKELVKQGCPDVPGIKYDEVKTALNR